MNCDHAEARSAVRIVLTMPMSPEEWAHAKVGFGSNPVIMRIDDARKFLSLEFFPALVGNNEWDQIKRYLFVVVPLMRLDRANTCIFVNNKKPRSSYCPTGKWWVSKEDLERVLEENKENIDPGSRHSINVFYTAIRDTTTNNEVREQINELLKPCAPEYMETKN